MKSFFMPGDENRLYFRNLNKISDEQEYKMVMHCLKNADCEIGDKIVGPDCDIIHCSHHGNEFDVIRTIDGDGTFIYSSNHAVLEELEDLFK